MYTRSPPVGMKEKGTYQTAKQVREKDTCQASKASKRHSNSDATCAARRKFQRKDLAGRGGGMCHVNNETKLLFFPCFPSCRGSPGADFYLHHLHSRNTTTSRSTWATETTATMTTPTTWTTEQTRSAREAFVRNHPLPDPSSYEANLKASPKLVSEVFEL